MKAAVHCAFDKMVKTHSLVPHPKNPNRHPDDQIDLLARIIANQGWRCPITVSNRSGYIVRGHGRLLAAQKPLECMSRPIRNHTCRTVYDPFCGTGTTILAAESLNRICFAMELDPKYVAVILERWLDGTGMEPKLCRKKS